MIYVIILTGISAILQVSILQGIAIANIMPDLVLILVIYTALFFGEPALWFGFTAGLFLDIYNLSMGYNSLLLCVLGYSIGFFAKRLRREVPLLWLLLIGSISIFRDTAILILQRELTLFFLIRYVVPSAIYTAFIGGIIFYILRQIRLGRI